MYNTAYGAVPAVDCGAFAGTRLYSQWIPQLKKGPPDKPTLPVGT
jgi:hypothetical protein